MQQRSELYSTLLECHQSILEKEGDDKIILRSSYNLIYGIVLGIYLTKSKLIYKSKSVEELLKRVEELNKELFEIDLIGYKLDDKTSELEKKYGKELFGKIRGKDMKSLWKDSEEFFLSVF